MLFSICFELLTKFPLKTPVETLNPDGFSQFGVAYLHKCVMIYVLLIANNRNSVQVTHNSFQNGKIEVVSRKVSTKTECIYSYTTFLLL
jgi:hypothetical protein